MDGGTPSLTPLDPLRLQVHVLPRTLIVRLVVDPRPFLCGRLRCRCLYRRQSPRLQQVVESSEAQGSLRGSQVDLRSVHHRLLRLPRVPMDQGMARHALREYNGKLP